MNADYAPGISLHPLPHRPRSVRPIGLQLLVIWVNDWQKPGEIQEVVYLARTEWVTMCHQIRN
jgi:hypothetical protein